MKNTAIITLITCVVAITACNRQTGTKTTSDASTGAKSTQPEIVYVNSDTLLNNYVYFKEIKDKLETKGKKAQGDLSSRGQAFQREVAEYQKSAQGMSAEQRQATEQRLARKQQELQAYNQNAGAQIQSEEAAEQQKLYDKVAEYLKGYAKIKGYKMVLTYQKGNSAILYGEPSLDVTREVLKGLNDEYQKNKK